MTVEVTHDRALVWGRCGGPGDLHVAVSGGARHAVAVDGSHDFTGTLRLDGLSPATAYTYDMWCGAVAPHGQSARGSFRTAPAPAQREPVRLVWGGDIGGQNVCRDKERGYPIFATLSRQDADAFLAVGDMIYADDPCLKAGRYGNAQIPGPNAPAADLAGFRAYWRYNRDDPGLQGLLASTASYAIWDDHEVRNDFGPQRASNAAGEDLLEPGKQAFREYNPMLGERMYRSFRRGRHVELFLLDTRSYRDPNDAADTPERPKSMLGRQQRAWLEASVARSDATWKIIVSSVPLVVPTGNDVRGRDGWSGLGTQTGYLHELRGILESFRRHGVRNHVWISTDVHFAAVFRHTPFPHAADFVFHEIETGPLHAGVFPKDEFDHSLGSERLFLYPQQWQPDPSFDEALSWFNFGVLSVDREGALRVEIINAENRLLYRLDLPPQG
jgi:alkaline phosphatase D